MPIAAVTPATTKAGTSAITNAQNCSRQNERETERDRKKERGCETLPGLHVSPAWLAVCAGSAHVENEATERKDYERVRHVPCEQLPRGGERRGEVCIVAHGHDAHCELVAEIEEASHVAWITGGREARTNESGGGATERDRENRYKPVEALPHIHTLSLCLLLSLSFERCLYQAQLV